jgi:hypothetical protein
MLAVQFAKMHQEKGRSVLLTAQQEEWLTIQRMIADTNLKVGNAPAAAMPLSCVSDSLTMALLRRVLKWASTCMHIADSAVIFHGRRCSTDRCSIRPE